MHLKTFIASLAVGSLLAACGGVETEEGTGDPTPSLATSEQGLCEGYDNGARRCSVRCTANGPWFFFEPGIVYYGECQPFGASYCGRTPSATCWSF
ncbi:hypothetical protein D7W79_14725 [Corallococcus exercitus]|uniref:Lipoprotein n=1 Tax=Corallococcus exercitus TaxID=2316736 RepID=A0A3A8I2W4_9BACT|nr:hypothetical protein [Corallococcus exercitus]NOK38584.1 hypothetical protein [Corallococcus exercitus]RKG77712.1 hypothetical protein D7W79_14725 [Corallococcus exercitus]